MSDDIDLLRRAAAKVRETAEAATPGRWSPERADGVMSDGPDRFVVFADYGSACSDEDGRHIALFDPTAGLAVAVLLEAIADDMALNGDGDLTHFEWAALEAARAILRGEAAKTPTGGA